MNVAKSNATDPRANPFGPPMQKSKVSVNKANADSPQWSITPRHIVQIPICALPERGKIFLWEVSIKPNQNVAPDPRREVHLRFKVKLDSNRKRRVLELSVLVDGSFEEISWGLVRAWPKV